LEHNSRLSYIPSIGLHVQNQSFTQNLQGFPSLLSCPCALKVAAFRLGVAVVVRLQSEHQLKYHLPGGAFLH